MCYHSGNLRHRELSYPLQRGCRELRLAFKQRPSANLPAVASQLLVEGVRAMAANRFGWVLRVVIDLGWMLGVVILVSLILTAAAFGIKGRDVHDGTVRLDDGRSIAFKTNAEYERLCEEHRGHVRGGDVVVGHADRWLPLLLPAPFLVIAVYVMIRDRRSLREWFRPRWGWTNPRVSCSRPAAPGGQRAS